MQTKAITVLKAVMFNSNQQYNTNFVLDNILASARNYTGQILTLQKKKTVIINEKFIIVKVMNNRIVGSSFKFE